MINRLHAATASHHTDADADYDTLFSRDVAAADYLVFLLRAYGFDGPVETMMGLTPHLETLVPVRDRSKAHFLAQDLGALGIRPLDLAEIPQCLAVPQFRGAAEALGWLYVIERSTLKHNVVRGHLQTRLPREMQAASAYLSAYEGRIGARWRELGETLDRVAAQPVIADRIVSAAHDAFRAHRRWVRQEFRSEHAAAI